MTFTTGQRTPSPQMSLAVTLYPPGTPPPAAAGALRPRPGDASPRELVGGEVVPAGRAAAGVPVVARNRSDQHHAPPARLRVVGEARGEGVVVGEMPTAVIRVVGDEDI